MKRSRYALAFASLALATLPASAELTWAWGGQASLSAYGIDQDEIPTDELNNFGFAGEGKVWGRVTTVTDTGVEYGFRAQLRFQSSEAEFSNDLIHGAPDFVDEVWVYVQTAFGRVTLGLEDGAADSAGIFSPTVSELNRIDDPRHFPLHDPDASSFTAFAPNGAHMRTDLNGSGDAFKILYYSPRLIGVQISASYTPELSRGLNDLFDGDDHFDEQSDIWEVGVNYQGALSGFDVGVYGGYVRGYNERETTPFLGLEVVAQPLAPAIPPSVFGASIIPGDLEEWGAGAQVAYEGLKVGGSYRITNVAGGGGLADKAIFPSTSVGCSQIAGCVLPDSQTTIWGAGVTYETGPWRFGAGYVNLEEELPLIFDNSQGGPAVPRNLTQDVQGYTGQVGYEIDENVQFVVGYQHFDFDGPAGVCIAGACDTLDADLGFFQTAISF